MAAKKTNPKRLPATQYDVERARKEGRYEGFNGLMALFLWVRAEDFGDEDMDLHRLRDRIMFYAEEMNAGRLRLYDILSALKEEHAITMEITERRKE